MTNAMGIIFTGDRDDQLRELTLRRAVAAVPFGGRYRIIDFPLSSMTSSGIRNIGVILQKNYNSLMDHLGSGREWDLHGKRNGLVQLPPFMTNDNVGVYSGSLDALRSNLHYLRRSKERYTVLTDTHMMFSAKFDEMIEAHEKSGADVTLLYTRDPGVRRNGSGTYIDMDDNGRVTTMEVNSIIPHVPYTYMESFCMRRELLIDLIDRAASRGQTHFTRGLLRGGIEDGTLHVQGFEHQGRVWALDSVESYFNCSMELLNPETRASLFSKDRPVLTKLRDEMPSRFLEGAEVKNSLVADGCVIEGRVENSILFRGVHIMKGATVKNCIIMQDGVVLSGAEIDHCILDKQTLIRENTRMIGPASYPIVIAKDMVI